MSGILFFIFASCHPLNHEQKRSEFGLNYNSEFGLNYNESKIKTICFVLPLLGELSSIVSDPVKNLL